MEHEDVSYTSPIAYEGEEIQWNLMAKDGIISEAEANCQIEEDAGIAKARLARKQPSRMSEVGRLKFMRTLSFHGWTEADLRATPALLPN